LKKKFNKKDGGAKYLIIFAVILAITIGRAIYLQPAAAPGAETKQAAPLELNFSQILQNADKKNIATMAIRDGIATGELRDGLKYTAAIDYDAALLEKIAKTGASVSLDKSRGWIDYLGTWVPILMGLLFIWWIFRGMRGGGVGGLPGKISQMNPTRITTGKTKTTFADVAGIDDAKTEVMEIVDFLKNPGKFRDLGARVPRGILLSGAPGTGKTLLARAIAGEANVPFFAASGSDFSGIIVGLGVAKIKEIFELAKKNAPCILFIDEIDAIGTKRGHSSFNDNDREQTLNQLLIEMDGFSNETNIIVVGATNRPDMLDPALLRPGRFDRQVYIELPDLAGRRAILDIYAKKFKFASGVDLADSARGTTGFSGADLENLLNEAALFAARANRTEITVADLDEARDKILMGPKKDKKMRAEDIKLTAYHEAGHAFMSTHFKGVVDPIHKATIIPRGRAAGMVQYLPTDDKVHLTLAELRADLVVSLAGRGAEELFFGRDKITTGAENDIATATYLARRAITVWGLSDKFGPVAINQMTRFESRGALENASEKTAELVDAEVKKWMDTAYKNARAILVKNKTRVKKLAEALLKRETLTREEIEKVLR
jgi:cell division protease FtsH